VEKTTTKTARDSGTCLSNRKDENCIFNLCRRIQIGFLPYDEMNGIVREEKSREKTVSVGVDAKV
jgi:hypothetical protein